MTPYWTSQAKVGAGDIRDGPGGPRGPHRIKRCDMTCGVKFMGSPYHLGATERLSDLPKAAQLVSDRGLVCDTNTHVLCNIAQ